MEVSKHYAHSVVTFLDILGFRNFVTESRYAEPVHQALDSLTTAAGTDHEDERGPWTLGPWGQTYFWVGRRLLPHDR